MSSTIKTIGFLPALALLASACSDRARVWHEPIRPGATHGLVDSVAVVDDAASRILLATPHADGSLDRSWHRIGHNVVRTATSRDRSTMFALSAGDHPRKRDTDERASLSVIVRKDNVATVRSYPLGQALSGMTIDPLGRYVALHAATADSAGTVAPSARQNTAFVENPNEVIIVDLSVPDAEGAIVARSLRSFGGKPQRFTFTPALSLPGGSRRLLVVETEQDVALVDLDHLRDPTPRPEITVRLGSGSTTDILRPAGLVVDDGDPARNDDARIAIRAEGNSSVVTLSLGAPGGAEPGITPAANPNDFAPIVNLVDVGGPASDLAFVRTDGGLRLAALVPTRANAVLIEPDSGLTERVALPAAYSRMSLVTGAVSGNAPPPAASDVALLWGGSESGVAFWALGKTAGEPYRSVEVIAVGGGVTSVEEIPPPRPELKVLALQPGSAQSSFSILNLRERTAAPLVSSARSIALEIAADAERAWAFERRSTRLASIALADARPLSLDLERPIDALYDVATVDGDRALVAVHAVGAIGLTVLSAKAPDPARAVGYSGLLLEGLPQ